MTIEGRPNIQVSDTYWDNEYAKQRKCRMQDAIDDYLQDEKVSSRQTYEEMLSCIDDVINYHAESLNRAAELRSLMMGNRPVDLDAWRDRSEHREAYHELQDLFYRTDAELAEVKEKLMKCKCTDK